MTSPTGTIRTLAGRLRESLAGEHARVIERFLSAAFHE
jgi:hypothetical protein